MKKIICLGVVVLLIAAVAFAAAKKVPIAEKDLPGLKGTWEGILTFGVFDVRTAPCTLEILSDKVPVKGKLTIDVPQEVAQVFGMMSGKQIAENNEGKISKQGSLIWTSGDAAAHFVEVWFDDAKKLELFYFYKGVRGNAFLTKKK
jgi:hypothetical protein